MNCVRHAPGPSTSRARAESRQSINGVVSRRRHLGQYGFVLTVVVSVSRLVTLFYHNAPCHFPVRLWVVGGSARAVISGSAHDPL